MFKTGNRVRILIGEDAQKIGTIIQEATFWSNALVQFENGEVGGYSEKYLVLA